MGGAMPTSALYAWGAVTLSAIGLMLSVVYLARVAKAYRKFHDERAAVALAKAVGLAVIAVGLTISATGLLVEQAVFSTLGLSITRGAFIVLMATLVLADVRPGNGGSG